MKNFLFQLTSIHKEKLLVWMFVIVATAILLATVRGLPGNPSEHELLSTKWQTGGPLELSPERGRFALTYSLIENRSFIFSPALAQFSTPDLGYKNGNFVSLFAPGLSFLVAPGYLIGKYFGLSQVGSYLVISLFALLNSILIIRISSLLNAKKAASILAASTFLFATPAFAYSVSLYQHHVSTFLLLASLYLLLKFKTHWWSLSIVWALCAFSIPLDYPNLFFLFPVGVYGLTQFISLKEVKRSIEIVIAPWKILTFLSMLGPIIFFFWFNNASYGNPFQFSGTVEAIKMLDSRGNPIREEQIPSINQFISTDSSQIEEENIEKKSAIGFFLTRNLLNGFYTHFISQDRGILYFAPVMLLAIPGIFLLYKKNANITSLFLAIIGANVLLYSMWGDPYGGWAFGSRYLIPTYAICSLFIAQFCSINRRKVAVIIIFSTFFSYSVLVNSLGALTSNLNPPKNEVLSLESQTGVEEKYTFDRNLDLLKSNFSKSFAYQTYFSKSVTAEQYHLIISAIILTFNGILALSLLSLNDRLKNWKIKHAK